MISINNEVICTISYMLSSCAYCGGPNLFTYDGKNFDVINYENLDEANLYEIYGMYQGNNKAWFSTFNDSLVYYLADDRIYSVEIGMKFDGIFTMTEHYNMLWVGTGKGIYKYTTY